MSGRLRRVVAVLSAVLAVGGLMAVAPADAATDRGRLIVVPGRILDTRSELGSGSGNGSGSSAKPAVRDAAVEQLIRLGQTDYSQAYGGIEVRPDGSGIVVFLTGAGSRSYEAASAALHRADLGVSTTFKAVAHSRADILALQRTLVADYSSLKSNGININEFGPEVETGLEGIGVIGLTKQESDYLAQRYGADMIDVYNVPAIADGASGEQASRTNDYSPWNASDVVWGYLDVSTPTGCSTGFGFRLTASGERRVFTAGHCMDVDSPVYNASQGSVDVSNKVGYLKSTAYDDPTPLDVAAIAADPGSLWRGEIGDPYNTTPAGVLANVKNMSVCADGAYGGEKCGFTVQATDLCKSLDGKLTCSLVSATGGSSHTIGGDSGGPWFSLSNGSVYEVGIHRGLVDGVEYYTGMKAALAHYGGEFCVDCK